MIEIIAIILLANLNARNAAARGRNPGSFSVLTIGLWFGSELIGVLIGMVTTSGDMISVYGFALVFAFIGGIASYIIAKNCSPGEHKEIQYAPLAGARQLEIPCTLNIVRVKSFVSMVMTYSIYLNGQHIGDLKNGAALQVSIDLEQNTLVAKDSLGTELKPLFFAVSDQGNAQITFGPSRFITEKCTGIRLLNDTDFTKAEIPYQQTAIGQQISGNYTPNPTDQTPPVVAFWVLGGTLLFALFNTMTFTPWFSRSLHLTMELTALSFSLLLSACIYLMLREDTRYKIISGAGLFLGAIIYAFATVYLQVYGRMMQAPPWGAIMNDPVFAYYLKLYFTIAVAIGLCTFIIKAVYKASDKQQLMLAAWLSAMLMFLIKFFRAYAYIFIYPDMPFIRRAGSLVGIIEDALFIVLFTLIIYQISTLKRKELITGTGPKIWFSVCILFTTISIIVGLVAQSLGIASVIIALVGIAGYILLLMSRRQGFLILLAAVVINVAAGISTGMTGNQPSWLNVLIALAGLINPLITWLVIRQAWVENQTTGITAQQSQPQAAAYPAGGYCIKCGSQLAVGMKFCPDCGATVIPPGTTSTILAQDTISTNSNNIGPQTNNIATAQETSVTTAQTLLDSNTQNRFYVFAVQGPAFGVNNGGDVVLEKAQKLKDEYEPARDMELVTIRPHMWNASIQSNSTGGMISVSYNFSNFVDEIRQYLSTKENIGAKLIEQGIALCEENSLQLSNPMSGVFVMGIPIITVEESQTTLSVSCVHDYKHFICTKCGEKVAKPILVSQGMRRQNQFTYEDYVAENAEEAIYFLEQTLVTEPLYYVMVHTPQGNWGKDKDAIFLAQLCDFQKDLSLYQCDAKTALMPERMSDLQMAANKISDNFMLSITCGECGYNWVDGVGYRTKTIVKCPDCGKYNLANTENIRFNDL